MYEPKIEMLQHHFHANYIKKDIITLAALIGIFYSLVTIQCIVFYWIFGLNFTLKKNSGCFTYYQLGLVEAVYLDRNVKLY